MDKVLKGILAEFVTDEKKIKSDALLKEDLGIDSYGLLDLLISLQTAYRFNQRPFDFMTRCKSVNDLECLIKENRVK